MKYRGWTISEQNPRGYKGDLHGTILRADNMDCLFGKIDRHMDGPIIGCGQGRTFEENEQSGLVAGFAVMVILFFLLGFLLGCLL